jgi:hypothetical protein
MNLPADKPREAAAAPTSPGVATVREALLAEVLGDAHKLLQRLEAMEQRIQALAEQVEAKSTRFEAQAARYTKAVGDLQLAAQGLLRRDLEAGSRRLQVADATAAQPETAVASAAVARQEPQAPSSHPPSGRWSRHRQLQPFWLRHAWSIFLAGMASAVLAGIWVVKF